MTDHAKHPALVRTTNALFTVAARQRRNALPAFVAVVAALGLPLGALAAILV